MRRFLSLLLILYILVTPVLAHPGRTDAAGGHWDHSTGEYHYHHGYSAHQHYDMDGDGIPDCPYNFRDATDHSKSGSSSSNIQTSTTESELGTEYTDVDTIAPKKHKKLSENVKVLLAVLLYLGGSWAIMFLLWHLGGVI